ncbi:hypothetical protein ACQJBY_029607 [Aegilops geniculata]
MAMGAWWAMKKSLLVKLSVYLLLIAMANCARDNPDSVAKHPPVSVYTCDDISETWHGGLCAKHGTCNKPCRAEGYDSGFCACSTAAARRTVPRLCSHAGAASCADNSLHY